MSDENKMVWWYEQGFALSLFHVPFHERQVFLSHRVFALAMREEGFCVKEPAHEFLGIVSEDFRQFVNIDSSDVEVIVVVDD